MVDDTPSKHRRNYGNLVTVKAFIGDQQDNELLLLTTYLKQLAKESNIRKVEKRYWRIQVGDLFKSQLK
jgi:RNA polymerase II subunit A small phosphatase-like protein